MPTGCRMFPPPESETQRRAAPRSYEILDTLPEQAYDDITGLAAQVCGTPIALVSLVDHEHDGSSPGWVLTCRSCRGT